MALRIRRHKPGELVQLRSDDGGHTLRGTVVAGEKTDGGMSIRLLSVPGYDGLLARVPTRRLSPADPFEPVPVDSINRTAATPAEAQRLLVVLELSVRNTELLHEPPDGAVLRDRAQLAEALGSWSGSGAEQVLACASASAQEAVEGNKPLTPAQLAAENFPACDLAAPGPVAQPIRTAQTDSKQRSQRIN
ncbi:hypothetical protein [Actinocorallia libanotica]|uniref:Uncharacterized protein n=1 Tax=Actinocorallia libanotica TaxID=46162 RepID=A0ABN1RWB3_9ACTN